MKESKAVSVAKHELKHTERLYDVYINKVKDDRRSYTFSKDVGCQYDVKKNVNCACHNAATSKKRDMYFSGLPKQVYAYHGTRSVTDVGVGSVKALQRKRVRRIYLPETDDRGIGSEDLSAFVTRRAKPIPRIGYYDQKKTSSKCVGGIIEYNTGCVLNEKLSPIVQTRSGATSPSDWRINTEVASNTIGKDMVTNTTQVEPDVHGDVLDNAKNTDNVEEIHFKPIDKNSQEATCSKNRETAAVENPQSKGKRTNQVDRVVSSDSLVQHVHNLENPSDYKQSRTSMDPMENKLEREYRKIFSTKGKEKRANEKPTSDLKSASVLRRRFEALRRGAVKKEDSKKNAVIAKESSQAGVPIRKDVSIASDPPSLEGRSFSNTKTYSPFHFNNEPEKSICKPSTSRRKSSTEKRDKDNLQWSQMGHDDSDCQGVKGMFKLWGKTFNLEEDTYKKQSTIPSHQRINTFNKQPEKKAELKLEKTVKKDGRKFFFFKKKSKEKSKPYKSKKGLTAGRCEVGDGLTIKIDGNTFNAVESKKKMQIPEDILRKQWLHKYLTHAIESKNSVQIRWNNKTYATSSSTIFELMDTVYQDAGIVFRSRSEVMTGDSSFYRSRTQHVNFAHQEIEAWMIPKTVVDPPKQKRKKFKNLMSKDNTEVRMSTQKWFIDKAKAFSRKIEVVLHTKHVVRTPKESSSEYLRIDIPKGFFIESSSDENRKPSSDEEVYKIVEYETEFDSKRNKKDMATGDHPADVVKLNVPEKIKNLEPNILETFIKGPASRRDVVIQGSDVNIPKRCDVIGVGIITQRDLRDIRKPILKIQDYLSDEESDPNLKPIPKKCEFAESYLQDYYRHWTPLGMDLFSWCVSDTHVRCDSENSEGSYYNQGDGSKSCPNIYDDFHTSAILSANNGCDSCCPAILPDFEEVKPVDIEIFKCKWLKKLKSKKSTINDSAKRVLPKDSLEVFKRRKIYASSDKAKWTCSSYCDIKPYSVPSIEDKEAQGLAAEMSKSTVGSRGMDARQRPCRKHVSMKEDGTYEYVTKSEGSPAGILMFRGASGCDVCKEAAGICPKHATVDPNSCEIPEPSCRSFCLDDPNPACSPVNLLPNNEPTQNQCREPPSPEPEKPIKPPCLTDENLEKGPPCQECRSFMEDSSPASSSQEQSLPTDTNLPTKTDLLKEKKSSMNKKPSINKKPSMNKRPSTVTNPPSDSSPPAKQASILCPHFPPCRKSQSCQKSADTTQNFPEKCPKLSCYDREALKQPVCDGPPCVVRSNLKNKEEKGKIVAPPSSKCNIQPRKRPPSPKGSEQFPWPLKSQKSDQSTQDMPICPSRFKTSTRKPFECHEDCPLSPKYSTQTMAPKKGTDVECEGKCGSKLSKAPSIPTDCTGPCASPVKKKKSIPATRSISNASSDCTGPCASPVKNKRANPVKPSVPIKPTDCTGPCALPVKGKQSAPVDPSLSVTPTDTLSPPAAPDKEKQSAPVAPSIPTIPTNTLSPPAPPDKKKQSTPVAPSTAPTVSTSPPAPPDKEKNSPLVLPVDRPKNKTGPKNKRNLKTELPNEKLCSKECPAGGECVEDDKGVIQLNSRERITISMKAPTPSTEEIREAMNIKVKDDDGNTLYERIDYRQSCKPCRPSLLEDMYKSSDVNRCSTPITIKNVQTSHEREKVEEVDNKSDSSIANLVEIQFKLKIAQGDKTTELSIGKNKVNSHLGHIKKSEISTIPQDVFVVKDNDDNLCAKPSPKNDVNIRIVIKNFKPKSDKRKNNKYDEDFSQNICNKFHTVSTGYSDAYTGQKLDNVFSIHRATIDLTTSNDKLKTQTEPCENKSRVEFKDDLSKINKSSHEAKLNPSASKLETDKFDEKSFVICKKLNEDNAKGSQNYLPDQEVRASMYTDSEDQDNLDFTTSNADSGMFIQKPRNKEEKKELLKKVMEKAHNTKNKTKDRMKQLRDMLKVILTSDSSGHEEMAVTSNELLKDVTFASLRPDFFNETDSMNTSYNIGSMLSLGNDSETKYYPTVEQNSECSRSEEEPVRNETGQGCMCNTFAERLNLCGLGDGRCCCRGKQTRSEQTSCDITTENNILFMDIKSAELVDVETQQSKYFSSRAASASYSIRSGTTSNTFKNKPTVSAHFEQITAKYKVRENIKERLPKRIVPLTRTNSKENTKVFNRNISINLSQDDKAVLLKATPTNVSTDVKKSNNVKGKAKIVRKPHILQSYATKKAVLEIYAEKIFEEDGEHTVAKLPKFVYDKESEIRRYQQKLCHYNRLCKKNVVMMSVER